MYKCEIWSNTWTWKWSDGKEFYLNINVLYPWEESPYFFSSQIYLFKTFYRNFPLKMYSFLKCQFKYISDKNILSSYICKIMKSFSRPRSIEYKKPLSASSVDRDIPPTIYKVLTHMRCIYFIWKIILVSNIFAGIPPQF